LYSVRPLDFSMEAPWTALEAATDAVSKKMLLTHMQKNCSTQFLTEHNLMGQPNQVLKRLTKDAMVAAYQVSIGEGRDRGPVDYSSHVPAPARMFKFEPPATSGIAQGDTPPAFTFSPAAGSTPSVTSDLFATATPAERPAFAFNFSSPIAALKGNDQDGNEDEGEDEDYAPSKGKKTFDVSTVLQKRMEQLNLSAAQRRDQTIAELPSAVRERVEKLEKLQESTDSLQKEFEQKLKALRQEYEGKYAPLYRERSIVVKGETGAAEIGVPGFWMQAFQNNVMLAEEIHKHDEPVLAYLLDVKTSTQLSGGKQGFQLAFVFADNPYFCNQLLTKTYLMDPEDEDECLERAAGCTIIWKEGMNVTVKMVQKKQKKKGKTRTVKVEEPADSFFSVLRPA